jgi:hypothetical protein
MADRKTLGIIGFILGGVTAAVMIVGAMVVQSHIDGRLTLDGQDRPMVSASLPSIVR